MVDRVRALKIESSAISGTEDDYVPTETDPTEDYLDAAGVTINRVGTDDDVVRLDRDGMDQMLLRDAVTGPHALDAFLLDLEHRTIRQLIHFIDDGPAEGFASGAFREVLPAADPFPTSIIWWESAAKLKKIVEKTITRSGGGATNVTPTPIVWKIYDTDGTTVLATVSDAITYSGVFETSRTRTIS